MGSTTGADYFEYLDMPLKFSTRKKKTRNLSRQLKREKCAQKLFLFEYLKLLCCTCHIKQSRNWHHCWVAAKSEWQSTLKTTFQIMYAVSRKEMVVKKKKLHTNTVWSTGGARSALVPPLSSKFVGPGAKRANGKRTCIIKLTLLKQQTCTINFIEYNDYTFIRTGQHFNERINVEIKFYLIKVTIADDFIWTEGII